MLNTILTIWLLIIFLMTLVWFIFIWKKNPGIVDVFWSVAITLSALIFSGFDKADMIKTVLQVMLFIWAIRLSGYLFLKRILPAHLDKRYEALSNQWTISKNIGFFFNFQMQGIFAIIISIPFVFIAQIKHVNIFSILGILFVTLGIIGESIADFQLQKFKKSKVKQVCNVGLWYYSRHPNYFFEWLIWLGFSLAGLSVNFGWIGLISPIFLLFLMIKVTIPITENASIKSRATAYITYQKITSMFVPYPPRKEK